MTAQLTRRTVLVSLAAMLLVVPLTGVSCQPPCRGGRGTPLNECSATINVIQPATGTTVPVTARLLDGCGETFMRDTGQAVEINGIPLSGPNAQGQYTADVSRASIYQVTVREPTRGVESTDVIGPGDFLITAPPAAGPASLSGFTLEWSGADGRLEVDITLTQTLLNRTAVKQISAIADSGSHVISANDLRDFGQGSAISITLLKRARMDDLNGFKFGMATVVATTTSSVTPVP